METTIDIVYQTSHHKVSELPHEYGDRVHILGNPTLIHLLNTFSSTQLTHPFIITSYVKRIYQIILYESLPVICSLTSSTYQSRMVEYTPKGQFESIGFDPASQFVCTSLARAGIIPSQTCYEDLLTIVGPSSTRQDYFSCERAINGNGEVEGTTLSSAKVGGDIQDRVIIIPDPMGATGSTIETVLSFYDTQVEGTPRHIAALFMIIAPECIHRLTQKFPNLTIVAGRLDRGLSEPAILNSTLGAYPEGEKGLTEKSYIVPGAGGVGEIINNTTC